MIGQDSTGMSEIFITLRRLRIQNLDFMPSQTQWGLFLYTPHSDTLLRRVSCIGLCIAKKIKGVQVQDHKHLYRKETDGGTADYCTVDRLWAHMVDAKS